MPSDLKFVYICSPYRPSENTAPTLRLMERSKNIELCCAACRIAIENGFTPIAPHIYFTRFLNDEDEDQREIGMDIGLKLVEKCEELWVFGDRISSGMSREIAVATKNGIPVKIFAISEDENQ